MLMKANERRGEDLMREKRFDAMPPVFLLGALLALFVGAGLSQERAAAPAQRVLTGRAALGDWTTDAPGVRRRITAADLPKPYESRSVNNHPRIVKRPEGARPRVPAAVAELDGLAHRARLDQVEPVAQGRPPWAGSSTP